MSKTSAGEPLISSCLTAIEERLGWGDSANWSRSDFENLSDIILDKTGVTLSVTTLKRIWGKVKYDNKPTVTTLNTLVQFLDVESWRVFVQQNDKPLVNAAPVIEQPQPVNASPAVLQKPRRRPVGSWMLGLATVVFLVTFSSFYFLRRNLEKPPVINPSEFSFSANKVVTVGVPNSVIFNYDASAAPSDSVFIVQTWDIKRKTLVSKNDHAHSSIYYYPGFFRTKLIVDSTIVKTHDLQVDTKGWLCLAGDGGVPLYFKKEEYEKKDRIEIDEEILKKYNLALNPVPPKICFFNQRDLGDLMNDNFTFETTLKNGFSGGSNACQYVEVLIQCKDDIIIIPLTAKPCVGGITLYAAGKELTSKYADLSGFGADLNQWVTLRIETKDKKMNIMVNNAPAASFVFPHQPCGIVGVQFRFNGVGAVRNTWFENKSGKIPMD